MDTLQTTIIAASHTYSTFILCFLGMIGIVLHNLVKIDSLNRKGQGSINLRQYFLVEWVTILISVIVVCLGAFFLQKELKQYFEMFTKYVGIGFLFFGYFAQSLLVKAAGKGEKYIDELNKPDTDNP